MTDSNQTKPLSFFRNIVRRWRLRRCKQGEHRYELLMGSFRIEDRTHGYQCIDCEKRHRSSDNSTHWRSNG